MDNQNPNQSAVGQPQQITTNNPDISALGLDPRQPVVINVIQQNNAQPTQHTQPTKRLKNTPATLGLVFGIFFWPLGLIFSVWGLVEASKKGNYGIGRATFGLVLSLLWVVASIASL